VHPHCVVFSYLFSPSPSLLFFLGGGGHTDCGGRVERHSSYLFFIPAGCAGTLLVVSFSRFDKSEKTLQLGFFASKVAQAVALDANCAARRICLKLKYLNFGEKFSRRRV